jgi:SagB-type dehydrogenase family enzyme
MTSPIVVLPFSEVVRLRPGVYRAVDRHEREYLLHRSASQEFGRLTDSQRDILQLLAAGDHAVESLRAEAHRRAGDDGVAEFDALLDRLRAGGWLHITVLHAGRPAYTLQPHRMPPPPSEKADRDGAVLSRFAVMRRSEADLLVESPRSWCTIRFHDAEAIAALTALAVPATAARDLAAPATVADDPSVRSNESPTPLAHRLRADLAWAGLLVPADGDEDTDVAYRLWSPHELWFHQRSRGDGAPDGHFGRTRWGAGQWEPLPGQRQPFPGPAIDLARPDLDAVRRADPTLTEVLERRRSIRRHDDARPVTLAQIGEFLHRAAGIRQAAAHDGVEYVTGPNPSGGALDPLEFYLAVRLVDGLGPGLYHYDRVGHRLELVSGPTRAVRRLVDAARNATGGSRQSPQTYPPQVVVVLAARFGRVGWSYETLTYSLILKQVGVAYQTMYCVATAMGLAPCGLGAGDSAAFAEASGLDPVREGTVGEFILGSRPDDGPDGPDPLAAT